MSVIDKIQELIDDEVEDGYTIGYLQQVQEWIKSDGVYAVLADVRPLLNFVDWILESKIQLCDKRCLMKDIDTEFGNVKSNYCERESCPDLVLKLLADNVRAHFI